LAPETWRCEVVTGNVGVGGLGTWAVPRRWRRWGVRGRPRRLRERPRRELHVIMDAGLVEWMEGWGASRMWSLSDVVREGCRRLREEEQGLDVVIEKP